MFMIFFIFSMDNYLVLSS